MLEQERGQYTPEALRIAQEEAEARGGLDRLKRAAAPTPSEGQRRERIEGGKRLAEGLLAKLIGRAPSERYPSLSYVAIVLRLVSFVVAAVAVGAFAIGLFELVAGDGGIGWLAAFFGSVQAAVIFALLYGGSELIHVVLDIEQNTRAGRSLLQEGPELPEASA